jgi:hypothetical protein
MTRSASDRAMPAPEEHCSPPQANTSPGASDARTDLPRPDWLQEAERRLQGHRSLLEKLTEEDWEFFRINDGPEVLGPPPPPPMKRRPRRRGET